MSERQSAKKNGFWSGLPLKFSIAAAAFGFAAQEAGAQNDEPLKPNVENVTPTNAGDMLSREDIADFREKAVEFRREIEENRRDMAEDILEAAEGLDAYKRPVRKDFSSREDYKQALSSWKEEHQAPQKKNFDNAAEYADAVRDYKDALSERMDEKMSVLTMLKLQEMGGVVQEAAVNVQEGTAGVLESAFKYGAKLADMEPSSKEYARTLGKYKKEASKQAQKMARKVRSMKGQPGVADVLQEMGNYLRNEKKLDAAIAKGVISNKKIVSAAEKEPGAPMVQAAARRLQGGR